MNTTQVPPSATATGPLAAGRIPELDAIRGAAALIVVFFHCWKALPWPEYSLLHGERAASGGWALWGLLFKITPLRIVTAGTASVGIFFILSGLVLALPLVNGRRDRYRDFLVKRFFRLYPPFAAAILLSAGLCSIVQPHAIGSLSDWFNRSWDEPISVHLLAGHLAMLGLDRDYHLDNVMWSLVHEVRISLLFPLLAYGVLRLPKISLLIGTLLVIGLSAGPVAGFIRDTLDTGVGAWPLATLLDTTRYLLYFVAGILLAVHLDRLVAALLRAHPLTRAICWVAAALLLLSHLSTLGDLAWPLGAALLIVSCLGSMRARAALNARPAQWLGRVSYSLYLVHVPILLTLLHLATGWAFQLGALLAVPALSLLVAQGFYRCVEQPSHRFGRYCVSRRSAAGYTSVPLPT